MVGQSHPWETMAPGQDLIVLGNIGQVGTQVIAIAREDELLTWFSKGYLKSLQEIVEISVNESKDYLQSIGITDVQLIEEGGIYAALWALSGKHQMGIEIELLKVPVRQSTVEICERYELNPYRLLSGNCLLLVSNHGYQTVAALNKMNIPCVVIGKVNSGIKREIYRGGERSFLERPKKDELKKVVPGYFKNK